MCQDHCFEGGGPLPQPQGGAYALFRPVRRNPFFTSVIDLLIGFQMFMLEDLMILNCGRHPVTMRTKCQRQQNRLKESELLIL